MSRRRFGTAPGRIGIVIGACLACACGSSGSSAQARHPTTPTATPPRAVRCAPRRAVVLASSRAAVVYTLPGVLHPGPVPRARRPGVALFGCLAANGRRVLLGTVSRVDRVALNHAAVAYATSAGRGIDTIATNVVVADLHRGHTLFDVPAEHISVAPRFVTIDALAVTPGGTVAWIQHGGTLESPGYSVHAASVAQPRDHQLAASPAIDPHSLRLTAARVSWAEAGRPRSAPV